MNIEFKNKTVLITGSTRGIGKQVCEDYRSLGAKVIQVGSKDYDFSCNKELQSFLTMLKKKEKIDICINNAGINHIDYLKDIKYDSFDNIMKVNLYAPFLISQAVAEIMTKNKFGRIINIASIWGSKTKEKRSSYTASKAGLIGLTRTMAAELGRYNVLVNSVSPGFTKTELTEKILTQHEIVSLEDKIPLKKFANVKDISNVIMFLTSEFNTYINGQDIIVDGGFVNV
jgi:NAD(P)-dependent dehydrogenase (short-subunit alcohol dehydrogenase family)